jgi:dipeptidyl aminopeptidase/acylaminoacyl peptidase
MSSVDWVPEVASALDRLVPLSGRSSADWNDVVTRARPRRLRSRRRARLVLVVALLFLLLAGTATAIHYAIRPSVGVVLPRGPNYLPVLDARGRPGKIPWFCPPRQFCGDLVSAALSPDGKVLATSSFEVGARSTFPGLHVTNLKTGVDWRIPAVQRYEWASNQTLLEVVRDGVRVLGCDIPGYLSWSPDGSRLAYACMFGRRGIHTIRHDGTGRRLIPTHTVRAFSPTWSPDGKRIAFSTGQIPRRADGSHVYVVNVDGTHLRRLAAGALPEWSPDGKTIAYVALGCNRAAQWGGRIRLVTPGGRDVTPASRGCRGIGPPDAQIAAWSPDGRRIAVAASPGLRMEGGLYVMKADGTGLRRVRRRYDLGLGLVLRAGGILGPLWEPRRR